MTRPGHIVCASPATLTVKSSVSMRNGIATTAIAFGFDLGAQPLGAVDRAAVLGMLRRLLCLAKLAIDLGAHSPLRRDRERIQSSQQCNRLARLRLGFCLAFTWTSTSLWL